MTQIYLDNNATTPLDPEVLKAMIPYFTEKFGNAASKNHPFGWEAEEAVEHARNIIAAELGARPREIIFTSGATESVNLAVKGFCEANEQIGKHIITQAIEHKAVLDTCAEMEKRGWDVTYLPVNSEGLIDLDELNSSLRDDTCLVTVYGPKGIGFLYVSQRNPKVNLKLQMDGGGHERGMRSGTLSVPLIVGLGKATEMCADLRDEESARMQSMRDTLLDGVLDALPDTVINGSMDHRLPNNINLSFPHVDGEALLMKLENIACSSGSACTSATLQPSYVMKALGHSEELAHSSIRIAFGRMNEENDTDTAIKEIVTAVTSLRKKSHVNSRKIIEPQS